MALLQDRCWCVFACLPVCNVCVFVCSLGACIFTVHFRLHKTTFLFSRIYRCMYVCMVSVPKCTYVCIYRYESMYIKKHASTFTLIQCILEFSKEFSKTFQCISLCQLCRR